MGGPPPVPWRGRALSLLQATAAKYALGRGRSARLPADPPAAGDTRARRPRPAATNLFATLVRHPRLLCRWVPFAQRLLSGSLPARDRELLVLRTGWRCRAEHEWGQHAVLARAAGLTRDEIARVREGPDAAEWDPFEAALLLAADELHDDASITDTTWATLAGRYDERQLIELLMLVGQYHLVAFTLSSIGVQRERGVPGL